MHADMEDLLEWIQEAYNNTMREQIKTKMKDMEEINKSLKFIWKRNNGTKSDSEIS